MLNDHCHRVSTHLQSINIIIIIIIIISWWHKTMRAARKVSSYFEYLKNWSRDLDVTWQPVRGDLTVHLWTAALPWGLSIGSETPLTELVYCVSVTFTIYQASRSVSPWQYTFPFYSSCAGLRVFGKASHHPGLSARLKPRFGSLRQSHCTQAQSMASHCRMTSLRGEWLFTDAQ